MIDVDYNQYKETLEENMRLITENHKLKELCDRYEEEHNNEFKKWQEAIQRIDKAIEYIMTESLNFDNETKYEYIGYAITEYHDKLVNILKGEQ